MDYYNVNENTILLKPNMSMIMMMCWKTLLLQVYRGVWTPEREETGWGATVGTPAHITQHAHVTTGAQGNSIRPPVQGKKRGRPCPGYTLAFCIISKAQASTLWWKAVLSYPILFLDNWCLLARALFGVHIRSLNLWNPTASTGYAIAFKYH